MNKLNKPILTISNLSKSYYDKDSETKALDNISFNVYDGDFISIVGPSGCGKTTILSILAGIQDKTDGEIISDKNIKLGYMLQKDALFPWLTVLDNCLLGLKINNSLTKEKKDKVIKMLKDYGLGEFINKYPNSLSGGMRQRGALIRTLAIDPDILILDEPFSALDFQTRHFLCDEVYDIIKKEKKTVILVTHNIEEALIMSNKIVVLTNRPATIKKIYDINYTNRSIPSHNRKCIEFQDYYDSIWRDLDGKIS